MEGLLFKAVSSHRPPCHLSVQSFLYKKIKNKKVKNESVQSYVLLNPTCKKESKKAAADFTSRFLRIRFTWMLK